MLEKCELYSLVDSSANPAHLPQKWIKWAELAVPAVGNAFFVYLTFPIVWSVPISAIKKVLEFYLFCKIMEFSKISLISSQQSFQFFKKSKKKKNHKFKNRGLKRV